MTAWPQVAIRDVATTYDGPHATPKSTKTHSSGPVFLGISSLQNGRLDLSQSGHLSEEDFRAWTRRVTPHEGDVVFSYETRLGEAAVVPPGLRCTLGRRLALMRPDISKIDSRFLLFYFLGPTFQEVIRLNTVHGSTVDRIMLRDFPDFPIMLPPLAEQRGIATTLGALDDKIESDQRQIALIQRLLELEFQRVIAGADVQDVSLGQLVALTKGVSYKSADLRPARTSLVTLKSFDRNGGYKPAGLKPYAGPYKPAHVIEPGELVVAQTDLTQDADVVGRAVRVPADDSADVLVGSLDLVIVRPLGEMSQEYLQGVLADDSFRQYCRSRTSGTTVLHLAGDAIPSYSAPIASSARQYQYTAFARPLIERLDLLNREINKLASTRDGLLPELLSGSIRVAEASMAVDEVVV